MFNNNMLQLVCTCSCTSDEEPCYVLALMTNSQNSTDFYCFIHVLPGYPIFVMHVKSTTCGIVLVYGSMGGTLSPGI